MAKRELSPLQQEYSNFFFDLLDEFEVSTPAKLDDVKKAEFFSRVKTDWKKKKKELKKQGIKGVNENLTANVKKRIINESIEEDEALRDTIRELIAQVLTDK